MILDDIVNYKKKQVEEEKVMRPLSGLKNKIIDMKTRDFKESLSKDGISIIAEIKRASPSKGIIKKNFHPESIAKAYEKVDIDAISVLTERKFFKGKDEYIKIVKDITTIPILRKDFIIDEYQIYQAKYIGADAVLLIVSILGKKLRSFYKLSQGLGLQCLVEVHDKKEIEIALQAGVDIIGINNRNLKDFTVNLKHTKELIKYIPKDKIIVSESGIKTPEDILYLSSIGANVVLIGETFMRNIENIQSINDFLAKAKGKTI